MNYCKDCRFRDSIKRCNCSGITEYGERPNNKNNYLEYSYNEGGSFYADDYFGCVHFERKEEDD